MTPRPIAAEVRLDGEHLPVERVRAGVRPAVDLDVDCVTTHANLPVQARN